MRLQTRMTRVRPDVYEFYFILLALASLFEEYWFIDFSSC